MTGLARDLHGRVAQAWTRGGRSTRAALALAGLLAAALLGAFLFGVWHVLFGGLVKGNWRAAGFGVALAASAGGLLVIEVAISRRLLPPAAHP